MAEGSGLDCGIGVATERDENDDLYKEWGPVTESVQAYRLGGYHPVLIGDTFKDGTYRVLKKIGYGSFSTVWLGRDTRKNQYVALKFIRAKFSENCKELEFHKHIAQVPSSDPGKAHVAHLLDTFTFIGPNGTHCCLVLELMGPNLQDMLDNNAQFKLWFGPDEYEDWGHWEYIYPINISKIICAQILQGLGFLHRQGITHGDIQPGNVLFTLPDISHLPESEVVPRQPIATNTPEEEYDLPHYEQSPQMRYVELRDGSTELPPSAPKYMVVAQPLTKFAKCDMALTVKLSDMGAAFWSSNINQRPVTPIALRAPEIWLCDSWDEKIDIWALGCVIYQIVTGKCLVNVLRFLQSDEELMDQCLAQIVEIIGPLPSALSSKWPNFSHRITADGTLRIFDKNQRRVPEHIPPLEDLIHMNHPPDATEEDMDLLCELLDAMLQYNPADRPTPEELLEFEWFKHHVELLPDHALQPESQAPHMQQELDEALPSATVEPSMNAPLCEESHTATLQGDQPQLPHDEITQPTTEMQTRTPSTPSVYFQRLLEAITKALRELFRSRNDDDER